ncbi:MULTISPECIES: hypothetical protein [Romboutsia]|jgi:hypothetical protein|uniref:hypothetical protein n=1 Tax=Romboutsia TaxID=1501226 RepID=UPI00216D0560|nr:MULTISPECIES: hypothetical protein [Romboutsia]MCI9061471.1 hypothetical protein [Romboutsia sp.]
MKYEEKVKRYDSENLLARTLNPNCYKNNPLFLKFINEKHFKFKYYNEFNKKEFLERNNLYKDLCKEIWSIERLDEICR